MRHAAHLVRRFFGSLRPGGPSEAGDRWARSQLLAGEAVLWDRMANPDKRHAVGVARDVDRRLGALAARPVLAAALLHDVGKVESGLRTPARVAATLTGMAAGHDVAHRLKERGGMRRRIGLYLLHADVGADLLSAAGSDPLTVAWTREHHRPPAEWTVPRDLAEALKVADDD